MFVLPPGFHRCDSATRSCAKSSAILSVARSKSVLSTKGVMAYKSRTRISSLRLDISSSVTSSPPQHTHCIFIIIFVIHNCSPLSHHCRYRNASLCSYPSLRQWSALREEQNGSPHSQSQCAPLCFSEQPISTRLI